MGSSKTNHPTKKVNYEMKTHSGPDLHSLCRPKARFLNAMAFVALGGKSGPEPIRRKCLRVFWVLL